MEQLNSPDDIRSRDNSRPPGEMTRIYSSAELKKNNSRFEDDTNNVRYESYDEKHIQSH